ncbi:uncharacterized protein CEXT_623861 [Caerostris extrusa]|uniref:Uncharacterized protein n=1 Tax=Caerostris extrusa TaxID=172846 RepID=A0AAV4MJS1_CAEEX|nr:uncharacterized protein CEXT_623861 [Caerostris extrusa]
MITSYGTKFFKSLFFTMDSPQGVDIDASSRSRKFGLPGWMVNNIERLNFATDFEQYACSPPETEGFLTEYMENQDRIHAPEEMEQMNVSENVKNFCEIARDSEKNSSSRNLLNSVEQISPDYQSIRRNFSQELFSSPDSTPCATPEPSPVIRRKVSIPQVHDTIQTNPGRWFYLGKFKGSSNKQSIIAKRERKENKEGIQHETDAIKKQEISLNKRPAIQLVISNFDLNAVSPNSW